MTRTRWYKDAVIYQIYPRSFCDSDGDGVGDIRGIIGKLDYIAFLGVNAVWLSPCYASPNDDNGSDISDYRDIMKEFGTLQDWQEMADGLHARGIKLIMDLVVNHTSDEHVWFQEAKKGKENPYRDYYIWQKGKGKGGKKPPNNWTSRFGGPAWTFDKESGEWYLHLFTRKQPDLNWDNPKVRSEVRDIVRYWLDKGCDGFRCDVITYISKVKGYPDGKYRLYGAGDEMFTHGPHIHEYLRELNRETFAKYDCMTVGEAAGVTVEQGLLYTAEDRNELDTVFTFEHMLPAKGFDLRRLKAVLSRWQYGLRDKGWNSLYYENHDQIRSLGRFTGDYKDKRKEAAKMLAVSYQLLQGAPYVYQGQEIGMVNYPFSSFSEMRDVVGEYIKRRLGKLYPWVKGIVFRELKARTRDHARTPMQWSAEKNAGFTHGVPWINVNPNYKEINVDESEKDPDSILNFYKKLIAFRKESAIIRNGIYKENQKNNKDVYCYERVWRGEKIMVICNFKNKNVPFKLPNDCAFNECELKLHNYPYDRSTLKDGILRPYETLVYHLK
jgi:oligo-1,6-glucosidase